MQINYDGYSKKIKIVLLGDAGVGKTSITNRFIRSTFTPEMDSTIGAAYNKLYLNINNNRINIEFWDTAGQERFRSMITSYFRNANACILVFDITQKK